MLIPEGYSQCNLRFTGTAAPQGAEVVIGINQPNTGVTPVEVAELVADAWVANVLENQVSAITLAEVLCKFGPNDDGPSATFSVGSAGSSSSTPWTPQVSVLVQKRSDDLGGRKHRGRMYVPGYPEAAADASGSIAGSLAGYQQDYDAFLAELDTGSHTMVILHNEEGLQPTRVDNLIVSSIVATQRRRVR